MASVGMQLLHGVVLEQDVKTLIGLEVGEEHFGVNELELYDYIKKHVKKNGVIPHPNTIKDKLGIQVKKPVEPLCYYEGQLKDKFLQRELKKSVLAVSDELKIMQPNTALEILIKSATALVRRKYGNKIIDFRHAAKVVKAMYTQKQLEGDDYGLKFHWETMDAMAGGLGAGDVLSIVARSGQGKTFMLLYLAHCAWQRNKKNIMFVTTEMLPELIVQRTAAMHTHKKLTNLQKAQMTTTGYKSMMSTLNLAKQFDQPFHIVDGNIAPTVEDIWLLAHQLKPDIIFIDGAYLLSHPNKQLNKFQRIAENAEMIKNALATDLGIPVACTWQLNRDGSKKNMKKDETPDLSSVAGSDAIPQLSSVVLALLEEDSLETIIKRRVTLMKGRSGEQGFFDINWDFNVMDFSEHFEDEMSNLSYI